MLDEFTRRLLFVIEPELCREKPDAERIVARVIQELGLREAAHTSVLDPDRLMAVSAATAREICENAVAMHRASIGAFLAKNVPMETTQESDRMGLGVRLTTSLVVITNQKPIASSNALTEPQVKALRLLFGGDRTAAQLGYLIGKTPASLGRTLTGREAERIGRDVALTLERRGFVAPSGEDMGDWPRWRITSAGRDKIRSMEQGKAP